MKTIFILGFILCVTVSLWLKSAAAQDAPIAVTAKTNVVTTTVLQPVQLTAAQTQAALTALAPIIQFPDVTNATEVIAIVHVNKRTGESRITFSTR